LRLAKLKQLLPAWSQAAERLRLQHERQSLAQQHFEQRQLQQLLLQWQKNAAESAHEQAQVAVAIELRNRRLIHMALQAWLTFCW